MTRHALLTPVEVCARGYAVVAVAAGSLIGRADITAAQVRDEKPRDSNVVPALLPDNPEHAHVIGWPTFSDKARVKAIATPLAALSTFERAPPAPPAAPI